MSYHDKNREELAVCIEETSNVTLLESRNPINTYEIHGFIMYTCWTVLSYLQLLSNRYLRHYWRWKQKMHTVVGTLMVLSTASGALVALEANDLTLDGDLHEFFGYCTLICVVTVGVLGAMSRTLGAGMCLKMDWRTP